MEYAVPRGNRQYAVWPPVGSLSRLVQQNAALLRSYSFNVLDKSAPEFARLCRRDISQAAARYAAEIGVPEAPLSPAPLIATGHQPELSHAGVWIKNFLAARLACALGGSSLNIIVDNDVPKHLGLAAPVVEGRSCRREEIEFARREGDRPFEEYGPSLELFDAFAAELSRIGKGTPFEDGAADLIRRLSSARGTGRSLGDVTSKARIVRERELGISNAEVAVSRLAETASFGVFVASILDDAGRFARCYNDALRKYRRANRIRSQAHPMPDLAIDGALIEAPFWVWTRGQGRGRLQVRRDGEVLELLHGRKTVGTLSSAGLAEAADGWAHLVNSGIKIRPRALTTTIYMRLFAADLFIHGIGGAKYDEVTDAVVRSFYGVEPPPHATISATLMLPWGFDPAERGDIGKLVRQLRDIQYNPQNFLANDSPPADADALIDEKWRLVDTAPADHEGRKAKFERIREINATLAQRLESLEHETEDSLEMVRAKLAADEVLFSREYSVFLVGTDKAAAFYDEALSPLAEAAPCAAKPSPEGQAPPER